MLISVVIATYNSEATLGECLDSLVDQTFTDFEVIIKDGGSSDGTLDIVDKYKDLMSMKVISSSDFGVYDAWNIALKEVDGDWVTFFGSDDLINSKCSLEKIANEISQLDLDIDMIFGKNIIIDIDGKVQEELGESWDNAKLELDKKMSVRHPGSFYKSSLVNKLNGFDDKFKIIGDYDFVIRASDVCRATFYDYSIVKHRIGGLSISPSRCMDIIKETIQLRRKHRLSPYFYIDKLFIKRFVLYTLSKTMGEKMSVSFFNGYKKLLKIIR
ncbi:glycosyltransferase [Vibrio furnissii]|uniref:glycosyltransferase n=1 Tax=Vibrio furnissii TaxID=29494 RepID=UPI001302A71B|nr:glycosyltransferase [Vibrio furnissii]